MKRDDFGMRIDEVRELATKYSKPELARMVKMGLIPPQQALMAGMMIDRIAKSAMEPPQTTVAEDVLAPSMPQPGIMGAPGAPAPSPGVTSLPSGLQNMAGGGIVAFADGGEADIPGYASGTLTDSRNDPAMRISPATQTRRDQDRYKILADELRDAQRRMMRGEPGAKSDFEALQREMRNIRPPRAESGLEALIPAAEAATPMAAKVNVPVANVAEEEAVYDPMTGLKITGPEPKPYSPEIKPGTIYEPNIIRDILQGKPGKPKPEVAAPAAPVVSKPPTRMDITPTERPEAPVQKATEEKIKPPAEIQAEQILVPKEREFSQEFGDIQQAYKEAGVDVDMYKNMMQELKDKKAGLAKRKEQALGSALMAFGLGLAGARKGQVFQQLSSEGQKALGLYMNNMDRISENEDKIDMLNRQIAMAENNFKRTGADSALSQVRQRRERIDQIEAKNAELRQRASEHQATVAANVYHTDIWAKVSGENAASQAAARLAAAQAQANRAGALTQKQQFDIEQQLRMELEPKLREKYKNLGSEERINKKVNDELRRRISQRIAEITSRPAGYGGSPPAQDMFSDWTVEGM